MLTLEFIMMTKLIIPANPQPKEDFDLSDYCIIKEAVSLSNYITKRNVQHRNGLTTRHVNR